MSEKENCCIWCGDPINAKYANKMFCDKKYCHMSFHYRRTKYFSGLSPIEFKKLILNWLSQDIPDHPNPHHPAHKLNEQMAEIYRNATSLLLVVTEKLNEGNKHEGH